jgi:hypothetical protein
MMVRYKMAVSNELIAELLVSENLPRGVRLVGVHGRVPNMPARYVTFDDENAPEYLQGHLVELIVYRDYDTGEVTFGDYRVVD